MGLRYYPLRHMRTNENNFIKQVCLLCFIYWWLFLQDLDILLEEEKKDEVFERFKEFKALVENLSKKKINILRSDNGGDSHQMNSMNTAKKLGLRGSSPFPIIHNKMVWQRERKEPSWKLWNKWYMIKISQCTYGQKQPEQQYVHNRIL